MTPEGFFLAQLIEDFRARSTVALARAISIIEDETDGFQDLLRTLLVRPPLAKRIGVTGPPGAGKSSLVAGMATICLAPVSYTHLRAHET